MTWFHVSQFSKCVIAIWVYSLELLVKSHKLKVLILSSSERQDIVKKPQWAFYTVKKCRMKHKFAP